ncbi:MAG TPA: hypothetical protein VFF52_08040 [Isosphaeraceae bacterium]|nr:hypothetical protein [Isosphaeraceae bacterium]
MPSRLTISLVVVLGGTSTVRAEAPAALTERLLIEGKLAEGEKALTRSPLAMLGGFVK